MVYGSVALPPIGKIHYRGWDIVYKNNENIQSFSGKVNPYAI